MVMAAPTGQPVASSRAGSGGWAAPALGRALDWGCAPGQRGLVLDQCDCHATRAVGAPERPERGGS